MGHITTEEANAESERNNAADELKDQRREKNNANLNEPQTVEVEGENAPDAKDEIESVEPEVECEKAHDEAKERTYDEPEPEPEVEARPADKEPEKEEPEKE
jgi:hypothetical protein